jgi:hypothetical protein
MLLAPLVMSLALAGNDPLRLDDHSPARLAVRPAPVFYSPAWESLRARDAEGEAIDRLQDEAPADEDED